MSKPGKNKKLNVEVERLRARVAWLESLFDFSDPEIVSHHAPNDAVTKDAVIVRLSHYERGRVEPEPFAEASDHGGGLMHSISDD